MRRSIMKTRHKGPGIGLGVEALERRDLMSADPLPVLMVLADQRDFYYREYNDTRVSLEAAGLGVVVAATTTNPTVAHPGSGQGSGSGIVTPDIALANVDAADYSAIVFVGGWGSSMYQYAHSDPNADGIVDNFYANGLYNGNAGTKQVVNNLINEFMATGKYVTALCHGVTVLAWARVDGVSPLEGRQVSVPLTVGAPVQFYAGQWRTDGYWWGQYDQATDNGAIANTAPGQYGNPNTQADDVVVDGQIITAENFNSAAYFGTVIAQQVLANYVPDVTDASWNLAENAAAGTVVGMVEGTDPDHEQSLSYAILAGNANNAFAIDEATGVVTVANPAALDFETLPVFTLTVQATDDGDPSMSDTGTITIHLQDVNESPVYMSGSNLMVFGTSGNDTVYLWSGSVTGQVFAWMNGTMYGSFQVPAGGRAMVQGGSGDDQIYATDLHMPATIFGQGGNDQITGGSANDILDGGDGMDRLWAGYGDDKVRGGAGDDYMCGCGGNDVLLGDAGNDYLDGYDGNDILLGGQGGDQLRGGSGEDLLIGGLTSYDNDSAALGAIFSVWTSPDSLLARTSLLYNGLANGVKLRPGETVFDDSAMDCLDGGLGGDWCFVLGNDYLHNDPNDVVTCA
jgi:putative intracellular protease/amidase